MMTRNILFICGSLNQTQQMDKISQHLGEFNLYFTPFYGDGLEDFASRAGLLNMTVLGGRHQADTRDYLSSRGLLVDFRGCDRNYDMVFTCSDLIVPWNIRRKRVVLIQEGITTSESPLYHLVRWGKIFPRYWANTSATGLSHSYDLFCVASEGYRNLFIHKGVSPERIAVTGIPNFDNFSAVNRREFPYSNYVLAATSPAGNLADVLACEKFIRKCVEIAAGRQLIFKLHPLENTSREGRLIHKYAPNAIFLNRGNVNPMIANADAVITQYSSCTFVALALGKETHTLLDIDESRLLMPLQNFGDSARRIAVLSRRILFIPLEHLLQRRRALYNRGRLQAWMRNFPKIGTQ
jgi:hypothetical protein